MACIFLHTGRHYALINARIGPETRSRNPNGRSTVYLGSDGYWHGRVTVGVKDDGRPDPTHVQAKTRADVTEKVRRLEQARDHGAVRKHGDRWTANRWFTRGIDNIAVPLRVTVNTGEGYGIDVERHLIPGVGAHWLERFEEYVSALRSSQAQRRGHLPPGRKGKAR
jgi:hypothetical protein